jgi:hypothetical protein
LATVTGKIILLREKNVIENNHCNLYFITEHKNLLRIFSL